MLITKHDDPTNKKLKTNWIYTKDENDKITKLVNLPLKMHTKPYYESYKTLKTEYDKNMLLVSQCYELYHSLVNTKERFNDNNNIHANIIPLKKPRHIGTILYDFSFIFSGLISETMWETMVKRKKKKLKVHVTKDHFYSRQAVGVYILHQILYNNDYSFDMFFGDIKEFTQVHWVTGAENRLLSEIQNSDIKNFMDWKKPYLEAGIVLLDYDMALEGIRVEKWSLPDNSFKRIFLDSCT